MSPLELQLKKAQKVEQEHLKDIGLREGLKNQLTKIKGHINTKEEKAAAKKAGRIIGKGHLKENKKYYDYLADMEKAFKKNE
jgi:hypothetical protein